MRRQGGGSGFVVLLLVLAVVFYLAMSNFKSVAPEALEIKKHNDARKAGLEPKQSSTSASADAWTPTPPSRPSLSTMDQTTSEHTTAVQEAASQAN